MQILTFISIFVCYASIEDNVHSGIEMLLLIANDSLQERINLIDGYEYLTNVMSQRIYLMNLTTLRDDMATNLVQDEILYERF